MIKKIRNKSGRFYAFHIARIFAAVIILQTLYFKFGALPESVALFEKLGVEPRGRIATGVLELIAGVLLLWPKKALYGAYVTALIMIGAIISHLAILGIDQLFYMAIATLIASMLVIYVKKNELA